MKRLNFRRSDVVGLACYAATASPWQFLIIMDMGKWTVSHRLIDPRQAVSAASTIQGPFETFDEAVAAANGKHRELAGLN